MSSKKKLIVFFVAALIVHFTLVFANSHLLSKGRLGQVDGEIKRLPMSDTTVIVGNSHAAAVEAELLPDAYNLASYGENIHQSYYRLNDLLNRKKKTPKRVLLSCDLWFLKNLLSTRDPNQCYWNSIEEWDELSNFADSRWDFYSQRLVSLLVPYKNFDVLLFDYLLAPKQPVGAMRGQGSAESEEPGERSFHREPTEKGLQNQLSDYGIYFFRGILRLCREAEVELFLVRFPVTRAYYYEYSEDYEPERFYAELEKIVESEYPQAQLVDLHDAFVEQDFMDPHHLKGGEPRKRMTLMIKERLEGRGR